MNESKINGGSGAGGLSRPIVIGGRGFEAGQVRFRVNEAIENFTKQMKNDGELEIVGLFIFMQHADGRASLVSGGALCPGDLASAAIGRAFVIESALTQESLSKCLLKPEESR